MESAKILSIFISGLLLGITGYSIFTAFGMFLIAIFVLGVILDSDFTEEIFYILLFIIILNTKQLINHCINQPKKEN